METYQIFILLGIIFFIIEIFSPGFIFASIAIGFFFTSIGSFLDFPVKWQIFMFIIGIVFTLSTVRPLMLKIGNKQKRVKTNQEALIGKKGRVVEQINNNIYTGRVSIDGDVWRSRSIDDVIIPINSAVEVVEIDSIILTVKPLNN